MIESPDQAVLEPARAAQPFGHHFEHHHGLDVDVGRVLAARQRLVDEFEVNLLVGRLDLEFLSQARIKEHRLRVDAFVVALDEPLVDVKRGCEALELGTVAIGEQRLSRLLQEPLNGMVPRVVAHCQRLPDEAAGELRGLRID